MLESKLRPLYQRLLILPVLHCGLVSRMTPTHVTLAGLFFGFLCLPLLAGGMPAGAAACLLISGYLDTLDGSLARLLQKGSNVGAALDITCDRLVEAAVILGLFLVDPTMRALPSLLMLSSVLICVTTFLVVGIFSKNDSEKGFHFSEGLMERAEAMILWITMMLFPRLFTPLAYTFSALVLVTALIRLTQFCKQQR